MIISNPGVAAEELHPSAPRRLERLRDRVGLAVILAGVSLNMLLMTALSPVLSTITAHFGGGDGSALKAQTIVTVSGIGIILGGFVAGWVVERVGLRGLLLLALAIYGVTGSAGLFIENTPALLGLRLLQGVGSAGIAASTFAMIGARFEGARRSRLLGYQGSFVAASGFVTLLLAGELAKWGGWRAPFALYLLAFVMLGLALFASLPAKPKPVARAAQGGALPLLRVMWPIYLMLVPLYAAAYMFFLQLSFILAGDGIANPAVQGRIMTVITAMNFVQGLFYGRLVERIGRKWMFCLILGMMAASNLAIGLSHDITATVIACGLAGLGGGALVPFITNLVLSRAPADQSGRAIGFQYMAMYIGDFLNPFIVTPMRRVIGNHEAFAVIGLLLAAAAVAQAVIRRSVGAK